MKPENLEELEKIINDMDSNYEYELKPYINVTNIAGKASIKLVEWMNSLIKIYNSEGGTK